MFCCWVYCHSQNMLPSGLHRVDFIWWFSKMFSSENSELVLPIIKWLLFLCLQRVHPSGCRSGGRFLRSGSRIRHRYRRWCRCSWYSTTAQAIRRNDPYSHFRRSIGSIRSYRRHLLIHKTVNALSTLHSLLSHALRLQAPTNPMYLPQLTGSR